MGTGESVEDACHSVEQHATLFEGEDGVLEGRLLLVVDNLLDVGTLLLDSSFDSRKIVTLLNLTEIRSFERKVALLQERILTTAPAFWANDEAGICSRAAAKPSVRNVLLSFIMFFVYIAIILQRYAFISDYRTFYGFLIVTKRREAVW